MVVKMVGATFTVALWLRAIFYGKTTTFKEGESFIVKEESFIVKGQP